MIPVTKSFIPPLEAYTAQVDRAFKNGWLTNRGELVKELEDKLKNYLAVDWMTVTNNGTISLQVALKCIGKKGEIITTPFSHVATTSAIVWEGCTPVFVDIHPEYLTIDEKKIEAAITEKTTCILATHVFGNPCHVEEIERIAKKNNIAVIYDAAHAFGVQYNNKSIFSYGDINTCSFHATKLFHTGEGGAMFAKSKKLQQKLYSHHDFGYETSPIISGLGINAKLSELQAAMGLSVLPYLDMIIAERKKVGEYYNQQLDFKRLKKLKIRERTYWNYIYYPVIFETEEELLRVQKKLNEKNIIPRRYFYPSLNTLPYISAPEMPISESIASTILCLPLYVGLKESQLKEICDLINTW